MNKFASRVAVGFFALWLVITAAGADHPPPPGFILIIIFDLAASLAVYRRVPSYVGWARTRKSKRLLLVLRDGVAAGLTVALLAILIPVRGEAGVPLTWSAPVIWFAVLGTVGAVNALLVYAVSSYFAPENYV